MDETRVDGTQSEAMEGTAAERSQDRSEETVDGDTAAAGSGANDGGNNVPDSEKVRRLWLSGFLRELVRVEGRMQAAELLGVAYRTVVKAEESGEITGRMGDALERLAGTGDHPEVARLGESVSALEERVTALEADLERLGGTVPWGSSAAMEDPSHVDERGEANKEHMPDDGTATEDRAGGRSQKVGGGGAGRTETEAAPAGDGPRQPRRVRLSRPNPDVVTAHPAEDDGEVYGGAWPLVAEWRRLREGHPNRGSSLSWLTTHERLLVLELSILEEHGLTLPPETQSLRGFGRRGQTSWRWKALSETRTALRKRKLLRRVRRVLTLWLWRD
ncbi:MAG: hypothetical protein OXL35_00025 [Chloroflexota bacterium]|nr:hypothetical protein [Chloroflexota bacterium]